MPENKNSRWKILKKKLRIKYRLVILNDTTYAEKFSLKLSPLGFIILVTSITIVMTTFVIMSIVSTPLREYIPGYGNVDDRKELIALTNRTDSLADVLTAKDWYLNNLINVFSGKVEAKPSKPTKDSTGKYASVNTDPSETDQKLRKDIENDRIESTNTKMSINKINEISNFLFYSPIKGIVTSSFNLTDEHFGTDIVAKENDVVKATLDGRVTFADYTMDDGFVIHIQHSHNLLSVYKHNSSISKKVGDFVSSGDPIAIIGNTGENSNDIHLHFELWYNGIAINPQEYISFDGF